MSRIEADVDAAGLVDDALVALTGASRVIGVTGPPGAGKSTLVGAMVSEYRARGLSVAALAIDPSSPDSGGAILGDRLRMGEHASDDGVFIRSMAARNLLGGLALAAPSVIRVLDALGFDRILVETVGVGQSELAVRDFVDCVVLVSAPGAGDGIQAMKSGVLEIGNIHVVNKADRDGAIRVKREIQAAIAPGEDGKRRTVLLAQADSGSGLSELVESIERYLTVAAEDGRLEGRRLCNLERETAALIEQRAVRRILERFDESLRADVKRGLGEGRSPYAMAEGVVAKLAGST